MKRTFLALMMLCIVLAVTGCGGGDDSVVTEILSDVNVDGDIMFDPATGSFKVTQVTRDNVPSVLAGIDPVTSEEFRAFLDFPLGSVPPNASIRSATLDIVINSLDVLQRTDSVPILIELVSFAPPLLASDFDSTVLLATAIVPPISFADVNRHVTVDVTSLMAEAQRRGLPSFQIRILEDFGFVTPGVIEIDESTDATAPLLTVVYF